MNEILNLAPYLLLFGIVLIGLSQLARFDEEQRHKMWTLYDSISDHRMASYKSMIDFLTGRSDVEVAFVREEN